MAQEQEVPEDGPSGVRQSAPTRTRIEAVLGDITTEDVDVIVNASNASLTPGGGVSGAIHAAAGPEMTHEARRLQRARWHDGLPVGEVAATGAGDLPARWVIHALGPNRHLGQTDPDDLASCFRRSLEVAAELGATSLAFPAISGGIFGWEADEVAEIAVASVRHTLRGGSAESSRPESSRPESSRPGSSRTESGSAGRELGEQFDVVRFVLFSQDMLTAFDRAIAGPPAESP